MLRAIFVALILACPAAVGQQAVVRCEGDWCVVHRDVLKMLIAQSDMNCGPLSERPKP